MSRPVPAERVGVDVGGTFTDVALFDGIAWRLAKVLTTSRRLQEGILEGIDRVAHSGYDRLRHFVHGSTLVPNAIIERKGVRTGMITTAGFRDILEFGREPRYDLFDLQLDKPSPLVPRSLCHEVVERIAADGTVLEPLDEGSVRAAARHLIAAGCRSVAVVLLHSFSNPAHEEQIGKILAAEFPQLDVSLSSRICPELGEYVRASTTTANAFVRPVVRQYVGELAVEMGCRGFVGHAYLMQSGGAAVTPDLAIEHAIQLIESGTAAGALAAAAWGERCGEPDLVSFDMGGTTAKICVIEDGAPARSSDVEVARLERFKRGSGLPLRLPVIEMLEIGAGGGSIASLNRLGLLQVGPESAGAEPGPACYGRGGSRPTVTDADLILGAIDPGYFLGGELLLSRPAAEAALMEHIGAPLGLDVVKAASGLAEVVDSTMADAMRLHVIERGGNPTDFAMFAFGGAGPVHAYELARRCRIRRILCPPYAGVASAVGLLTAQPAAEVSASRRIRIDRLAEVEIGSLLGTLEAEARARLASMGFERHVTIRRIAEMSYGGQGYHLPVAIPESVGPDDPQFAAALRQAFQAVYAATYGSVLGGRPIEVLTWRVRAETQRSDEELALLTGYYRAGTPLKGSRPVYFRESEAFIDCPVYERICLGPGNAIRGPAIIEERESTIVVGPSAQLRIDDHLTAIIDLD